MYVSAYTNVLLQNKYDDQYVSLKLADCTHYLIDTPVIATFALADRSWGTCTIEILFSQYLSLIICFITSSYKMQGGINQIAKL